MEETSALTGASEPSPINTVLVIGAGTMGGGIAQVLAEAGIETVLTDADPGALERGLAIISGRWDRALQSGRRSVEAITEARKALRSGALDDAASCDLAIEAIVEKLDAKTELFKTLARIAPPHTYFASNTSSIAITTLGQASGRPERLVGMHFFNPVPVLPLVEIVRGLATSDETVTMATALAGIIGKTPIVVNDGPGFVANRILLPMINEAVFTLEEGVASAEDIDSVMKLGMSHPMGPLALADLIGLDICLDIMETLHRDFGDDKYRPAPLLRRMVAAGRLGRKTGHGFYPY
jgi:3-hydroxybutyryl-CoA dehydrogenase